MTATQTPQGMVVTFYSYKGGVGRSMALANVAEILADAGYRVIVCDWDLEAPGIERYFADEDTEPFGQQPGIMDLLLEYKQQLREGGSGATSLLESLTPPSKYARFVRSSRSRSGSVRLLPAGRHSGPDSAAYASQVQQFDWNEFYEQWAGGSYLEFFRRQLLQDADVILIDSRTGVTEQGGVCTHHLADVVVLMMAANDLNIRGSLWMAERLNRPELTAFRAGRPLSLLPVASRIEQTSQKDELGAFRTRLEQRMAEFVAADVGDRVTYLRASEIPYIPYYSFEERVAAREREPHRQLLEAYQAVARAVALVGVRAGTIRPPASSDWLPEIADEAARRRATAQEAALAHTLSGHLAWLASAGATGQQATFRAMQLAAVDLSGRDLRQADFEQAAFDGTVLRKANLANARLVSASLKGCDLREAQLTGATLEGADLSGAGLQGALLDGANLRLARLQNANLGGASLAGADLAGANLEGASLKACRLQGARLAQTLGLTERQLRDAVIDAETQLPDEFVRALRGAQADLPDAAGAVPAPPPPVCYVSMPFGRKADPDGRVIDFDHVYMTAIRPAIHEAGLTPIRADEDMSGGIIHQSIFARLAASDFVVVDLTTLNSNVLYNLGLRHVLRPAHTVTLFWQGTRLPFDLSTQRMIVYGHPSASELTPEAAGDLRSRLAEHLRQLRGSRTSADSPIYQLLELTPPTLPASLADIDRPRAEYLRELFARLDAISTSPSGLKEFRWLWPQLGPVRNLPDEVALRCLRLLTVLNAAEDALVFAAQLAPDLQPREEVQFLRVRALIDLGRFPEASSVLQSLTGADDPRIAEWRGRVAEAQWKAAEDEGQKLKAKGHLLTAIQWYRRRFDATLTQTVAGIRLVRLLEAEGSHESLQLRDRVMPVLRYALDTRLADAPSYSDLSCAMVVAVIDNDERRAVDLGARLLSMHPDWRMRQMSKHDLSDVIRVRRNASPWMRDLLQAFDEP